MMRRCLELYTVQAGRIWRYLPDFLKHSSLGRAYSRHLHQFVCRYARRTQNHSTFFLRNRPEMELICRLLSGRGQGATVDIAVLACSKGAEVYSILWSIRRSRPDLKISLQALDIAQDIVDFANQGVYSLNRPVETPNANGTPLNRGTEDDPVVRNTLKDQGPNRSASIFERLDQGEMNAMFDRDGDRVRIKPWLRDGITWRTGDASAPELVGTLGQQDIVVANRFLCHMDPPAAERCLRNLVRLVKPGGYIFVSGVDLDVRTKVARELGWRPVSDLLREVYEGDSSLVGWPLTWWGLEPFCEDRDDGGIRYACVFQIGEAASGADTSAQTQLLRSTT